MTTLIVLLLSCFDWGQRILAVILIVVSKGRWCGTEIALWWSRNQDRLNNLIWACEFITGQEVTPCWEDWHCVRDFGILQCIQGVINDIGTYIP